MPILITVISLLQETGSSLKNWARGFSLSYAQIRILAKLSNLSRPWWTPQKSKRFFTFLAPAGLATRLLSLLSDKVHAQQLGQNGRKRVQEHFSLQRMITQYQELYTQYLG